MSLFRIKGYPKLVTSRCFAIVAGHNEEYLTTPQYPPIQDLSYKKKEEKKLGNINENIKAVKTVEEKQIKLNMPRFYGFKCHVLEENSIPYNNLPLTQHITRTHLIVNNNLPEYYKNVEVDDIVQNFKSEIEEALLIEFDGYLRKNDLRGGKIEKQEQEDIFASALSKQLNRLIINKFSNDYQHLRELQVDYNSRIEATWSVGGIDPPKSVLRFRKAVKWIEAYINDPVDRIMWYKGFPFLTLRSELPLPLIISPSEAENTDFNVPFFRYDPRAVGIGCTHHHIANIPGFWPGDPHKFGQLSFHQRGHLHSRDYFNDLQERYEAIHRQAILASFCWLHAQANNLGFTTYNDITYPLVTQTIITTGKLWSFYVYQMNTLLVNYTHVYENPKRNICWATEELKLFEDITEQKIIGLNDDVIRLLLKFYFNIPANRLGINLQPYLSSKEKIAADYEDDDKREWLEREFKFLTSERPRHKLMPEIYAWEKIYKIDNKTRFMEKRRTPFDRLEKPSKRRLDDRQAFYIPRKLRPDLPKWKGRYKKEYFP